ncbi:MAG: arsenic resistance N-acetyltransferase ArsN2 [Dehalococcoidia bacterium]|jgi:amino-acid N-acetyltransferase|nr:arsenic resistance N-acetyltransferase ArsN2 [Dehalococcoidia bacterium]
MSAPATAIRPARPEDRPAVERLLEAADLPLEGVADHFAHFVVAECDGAVGGAAGREPYGDAALVRSVVVAAELHGQQIGLRLVERALLDARSAGQHRLYLRTDGAERFFPRFGFAVIELEDVPRSVQQSAEFQGACPESCLTMAATLPGPPGVLRV